MRYFTYSADHVDFFNLLIIRCPRYLPLRHPRCANEPKTIPNFKLHLVTAQRLAIITIVKAKPGLVPGYISRDSTIPTPPIIFGCSATSRGALAWLPWRASQLFDGPDPAMGTMLQPHPPLTFPVDSMATSVQHDAHTSERLSASWTWRVWVGASPGRELLRRVRVRVRARNLFSDRILPRNISARLWRRRADTRACSGPGSEGRERNSVSPISNGGLAPCRACAHRPQTPRTIRGDSGTYRPPIPQVLQAHARERPQRPPLWRARPGLRRLRRRVRARRGTPAARERQQTPHAGGGAPRAVPRRRRVGARGRRPFVRRERLERRRERAGSVWTRGIGGGRVPCTRAPVILRARARRAVGIGPRARRPRRAFGGENRGREEDAQQQPSLEEPGWLPEVHGQVLSDMPRHLVITKTLRLRPGTAR